MKDKLKKILLTALCLMTLPLFCFCNTTETTAMNTENTVKITVINDVAEADIWILADTEANRKTTLWGTATVKKMAEGESRETMICEPGDNGQYLFRMIDADKFYYSADALSLEEGWTLRVSGEDIGSITLEVTDENGVLQNTYEVFCARL